MRKRQADLHYFDRAVEVAEKLQVSIRRAAPKEVPSDPHLHLSYFFFVKSLTSLAAARVLWAGGSYPDSLLLMRSMFETFVLDLYIRMDTSTLTAKYLAHEATARHSLSVGMLKSLKNSDCSWRQACKTYAAKYGRDAKLCPYEFEDTKSWSGKSLREIVRLIDRKRGIEGVWTDYEFFYSIGSAISHASSLSMQEYMTKPALTSYRRLAHRRGYLRDLPILACRWCLAIGSQCAVEHYQGNKDTRLAEANFHVRLLLDTLASDLEGKQVCTIPSLRRRSGSAIPKTPAAT